MRLMVCGSRDCRLPHSFIAEYLDSFTGSDALVSLLIVGDCRGPDAHARAWALSRGIPVVQYKAAWNEHGRAAGPIRNRRMVEAARPGMCVAFWDGESRGTLNAIEECIKRGVPVSIVPESTSGHAAKGSGLIDATMPKPQEGDADGAQK